MIFEKIDRSSWKRNVKVYILWRDILIYISTLKHILIQMDYCNFIKYKYSKRGAAYDLPEELKDLGMYLADTRAE